MRVREGYETTHDMHTHMHACRCMHTHTHTHTHTRTHARTHTGQNISLLMDVTKIGNGVMQKAVLVSMLRDARHKVDSCLMTLGRVSW